MPQLGVQKSSIYFRDCPIQRILEYCYFSTTISRAPVDIQFPLSSHGCLFNPHVQPKLPSPCLVAALPPTKSYLAAISHCVCLVL